MTSPSYVCLVPFPPSNPDPPVDALYHGPLPQSHSIRVRQGPSPPTVTPFLAPVVLVVGSLHSIDTATTCCAHRYLSRKGIYATLGSRSRAPAPSLRYCKNRRQRAALTPTSRASLLSIPACHSAIRAGVKHQVVLEHLVEVLGSRLSVHDEDQIAMELDGSSSFHGAGTS
jgi:hypothetical protein